MGNEGVRLWRVQGQLGSRLGAGGSTQERVEGRGDPTDISCGEKVAVERVG